MEIYEMTALEVAEKIRNKEITAMDAVEAVSEAIESRDKTYNCYTHFDKELAFEKAQAAQQLIDSGKAASPLAGVPVAIKDNICTKGDITSCASKILYNFKPPYNATVIQKLETAGVVPCGKVNMQWAPQPKLPFTVQQKIRGIHKEFRAVPPAVQQLLLLRKKALLHSVLIQAVLSVSPVLSAVLQV